MTLQQIEFIAPVPCGAGGTTKFWSIGNHGRTIQAERVAEGVKLTFGKRAGEDWQPTGQTVLVPFANIASITSAGEGVPVPDAVGPRGRSKT